jgi:NO-binding membrane sensor protein with MHYT domain
MRQTLLSLATASCAAYTAFELTRSTAGAGTPIPRTAWLLGAALVFSLGIWSAQWLAIPNGSLRLIPTFAAPDLLYPLVLMVLAAFVALGRIARDLPAARTMWESGALIGAAVAGAQAIVEVR